MTDPDRRHRALTGVPALPGPLAVALALLCVLAPARALGQQTPPAPVAAAEPAVSDDSRYALEAILTRLRAESSAAREEALASLERLEPSDVPAIRQRLLSPLGSSHLAVHAAMVRAIRAVTGGRENAEYDLRQALVQYSPRGPEVDIATERVALATALGSIRTADSGRALVAFGLSHNRIFRLASIRIAKNQLKEYVVPALTELRRPTEDMRMYIRAVREAIRRVTPGESVQTRDNALLAEVLRAMGSVRQQDAMAVVANYVNSDRVQVRDAARWAIAQYGRDAINVLRNTYETFVGSDPDPNWGSERVARELYAAYDRRKSDEVRAALDAGLQAARTDRPEVMLERFEWVLARHPLYERRGEMVEPLVRYARSLERTDVARAAVLYRMAARVDPEGPRAGEIRGAILFLEAERALARGVAEPALYRAAVTADPNHLRARAQYESVAQVELLNARRRRRAAGSVGLLIVAAAGIFVLAQGRSARVRRSPRPAPPKEDPSARAESTQGADGIAPSATRSTSLVERSEPTAERSEPGDADERTLATVSSPAAEEDASIGERSADPADPETRTEAASDPSSSQSPVTAAQTDSEGAVSAPEPPNDPRSAAAVADESASPAAALRTLEEAPPGIARGGDEPTSAAEPGLLDVLSTAVGVRLPGRGARR